MMMRVLGLWMWCWYFYWSNLSRTVYAKEKQQTHTNCSKIKESLTCSVSYIFILLIFYDYIITCSFHPVMFCEMLYFQNIIHQMIGDMLSKMIVTFCILKNTLFMEKVGQCFVTYLLIDYHDTCSFTLRAVWTLTFFH